MSLENSIKNLIAKTGAISVAQFMDDALAHHEHGYYQKQDPFGANGDFITAPEISQMFGELLGIWCVGVWQQMGCPSDVMLVELGPGRGTLMKDLLRGTKHVETFHNNISIHLVETSPELKKIQKANLSGSHPNINFHKAIDSLPQKPLILIANEFFDALPIHQYEKSHGYWYERMIGLDERGELVFTLAKNYAIHDALSMLHHNAPEGAIVEMCQQGVAIIADIASRIFKDGGAGLIIDYGYAHYAYQNTLQAVKNHKYHNPFKDIGDADLTAHVDFSAIRQAAHKFDVNISDVVTQSNLLMSLGIEIRAKYLLSKATDYQQREISSATDRLLNPNQMGNLFKAIAISAKELGTPLGF
jgi:NADH dehydrogenase [ubiquinone] 1 alpha subcomplex assembly factor 7